ncbi:MAG TPA: glycosyltransferase family 39 protein, partial [Elusimicrobiota bacterium]|nr:glycosyltransferase family 39 protein [Elusimicrobiota bacterium]
MNGILRKIAVGGRREDTLLVGALLTFFVLAALYRFHSPGTIYENLWDEWESVRLLENFRSTRAIPIPSYPIFHGQIMKYFLAPAFLVGGANFTTLRLAPVLFGVAVLLMFWYSLRRFGGRGVALLALFLTVIHPSFVLGMKIGSYQTSSMLIFSMTSVACLQFFWDAKKARYLFAAALAAGLGLGARLWFVWFLFALAAAT